MPTQVPKRAEIDLTAEKLPQVQLHRSKPKEPRDTPRLELDEQVDVTVGPELAAKRRAEELQPPYPITATKLHERIVVD